jgi:PIN domain nuclease of toxin-antitoxin system
MNYLLDTHILLWWLMDDADLPRRAREIVTDPAHSIHASAASLWEAGIKRAKKKLAAPESLIPYIRDSHILPLPISFEHAEAAARLPPLHADPFDRLLVAQAEVEGMLLLTADKALGEYGGHVRVV